MLYLAVRVNNMVYGVIGIALGNSPMDTFEKSIVLSILGECALALENEQSIREKEEAAVMAQNEQLRANLLRAISHDLRTPFDCNDQEMRAIFYRMKINLTKKRNFAYMEIFMMTPCG